MLRSIVIAMRGLRGCLGSVSCPAYSAPRSLPRISQACQMVQHVNLQQLLPTTGWAACRTLSTCRATASAADGSKPADSESMQSISSSRIAQLLKVQLPSYCSGCGVKLQQDDPDEPGFYQIPKRLIELAEEQASMRGQSLEHTPDEDVPAEEKQRRSLDKAMESWLDERQRPAALDDSADGDELQQEISIKCARCYSLSHYGKVKSDIAESVLPEFDLGKKVGRKIALQKDRRALVLCVVDLWDFDGSLPRAALASLFPGVGGDAPIPTDPEDLPFQLAVAVNKFDLLPTQATPKRVEQWVRTRLQQSGLPKPKRVFMVSALNGLGVKEMCKSLKDDMGFRADLWVVGAQNAGKSSLINAMKKLGGTGGKGEPTVASIPGTTLGLLRVPGIPLGPKHRTFDTPGVHHSFQLTSRLNLDELASVLPRRRLKPRTYRIPAGSTILVGGLARVDVVSAPSATVYVTIFVSDEVITHLGKTEGADERRSRHVGGLLTPPYDPERLQQLQLIPKTAVVEGHTWKMHSKDIAIAGLGWISIGCEGTTELRIWAPEGVAVTMHQALIPDYAKIFQKPGFSTLLPTKNLAETKKLSSSSSSASGTYVVDSGVGKAAAAAGRPAAAVGGKAAAVAAKPSMDQQDWVDAVAASVEAVGSSSSSRDEDSGSSEAVETARRRRRASSSSSRTSGRRGSTAGPGSSSRRGRSS